MARGMFAPNVASFGFGLFFATHAMSVWGGAFPLLPTDFQTYDVLITFFLVESLAFCAMLVAAMGLSYFRPALLRHRSSVLGSPFMTAGSLCLIAPLYVEPIMMLCVVVGGVLLGVGSALFFLSWQRYFASRDEERGALDLIVGMGLAAPLYALMHVIPGAVAAFSIPLVFIPLSEVCLMDASRSMSFDQPMFADEPRRHRGVYVHALDASLKSALCVGAFGFASGVTRAIAVRDPAMGAIVNGTAMAGMFVACVVLVWLWRRHSFSFDTSALFRLVSPVVVTAFLLLPYLNETYLHWFSGIMYMVFSFAVMVMMVQCMQAARNGGISPTFIYGFFAGIVYGLQACGFVLGYSADALWLQASPQLATFALVSTWVFVMASALAARPSRETSPALSQAEFVAWERPAVAAAGSGADAGLEEVPGTNADGAVAAAERGAGAGAATERHRGHRRRGEVAAPAIKDRVSKQCQVLTKRYLLTTRESEVMELLVRGNTAADIAKKLTISENTAKTHVKRLYAKLDVHKRRDLLALFEELDHESTG